MRRPADLAARALDGLLVVSACLGALTAIWWVLTATLGLGLVTFETGSMTPAFPVGSLAVTRPVALSAVRIGDVVTVDRGAEMPITHRVVAVRLTATGAEIRLKGDANRDPDPFPYEVRRLHVVVAPVPGALAPLAVLATPAGSAAVIALAALCVGWAFWPQRLTLRGRRRAEPAPGRHRAPDPERRRLAARFAR